MLASLNHPNIASIYAVEERGLVMEFVEGKTLAGPLPLETALNYARQIADALEAAHEKGIVHRDLKPANIKVTPQGVVKVLDFGLAAIAQTSTGDASNPSNSPTLTISPTRAGMILGTAAYMSPEQARGKTVDKRADIWAFGVVLYEMLTGNSGFHGRDDYGCSGSRGEGRAIWHECRPTSDACFNPVCRKTQSGGCKRSVIFDGYSKTPGRKLCRRPPACYGRSWRPSWPLSPWCWGSRTSAAQPNSPAFSNSR